MIAGMAGRLVSPVTIGRRAELDSGVGALDAAIAWAPMHLLVAGEAGVGKTRLAAELAAAAEARGMLVLRGGCANVGEDGLPYGPIVEILGQLVRDLDPDRLRVVVGASGADLARLVPGARAQHGRLAGPADVAAGAAVRRPDRRVAATVGDRPGPRDRRGRPLVRPGHPRDARLPGPVPAHRPRPARDDAALGRAPSTPSRAAVARRAGADRPPPADPAHAAHGGPDGRAARGHRGGAGGPRPGRADPSPVRGQPVLHRGAAARRDRAVGLRPAVDAPRDPARPPGRRRRTCTGCSASSRSRGAGSTTTCWSR